MPDEPRAVSWVTGGALLLFSVGSTGAFVALFGLERELGVVDERWVGDHRVSVIGLRAIELLPGLPRERIVVRGADGRDWSTDVGDPRDVAWSRDATRRSWVGHDDVMLVADGALWRAHDLRDGHVLWISARADVRENRIVLATPEVVLVMGDDHVVLALDRATGRKRWSRDGWSLEYGGGALALGRSEVVIGDEVVEARTGGRVAELGHQWCATPGEVLWVADGGVLMRRRGGGPSVAVLTDPLLRGVDCIADDDTTLVIASRSTAWAPGVAERTRPERVARGAVTPRDDTMLISLSRDSVRWIVASPDSVFDRSAWLDRFCRVGLSRIRGGAFESEWVTLDVRSGEVGSLGWE